MSPSFEAQFKPYLATLEQLELNAEKMNEAVTRMTTSSGDPLVDEQLLCETMLELEKGWADDPYLATWKRVPRSPDVFRSLSGSKEAHD